ncbi:hypothetical protein MMC07_001038 [Pseudocyphellaria aurata]|nr:hypothetical protein [Pseudocyphellaria aurata]
MKFFVLCLSLLIVEGLCRVDEPCTVQSSEKGYSKSLTGTYQTRGKCIESGRAAFSKSESTTAPTLSSEEGSSDKDEEALQCCVEITCGDNGKCRNNVEGNPCAKGAYLPNLNRARNLCPSSTSYDNVQCCSETIDHNAHSWLRTRSLNCFGITHDPDCDTWGRSSALSTTGASIANNYESAFASPVTTTTVGADNLGNTNFNAVGNQFATPGTTPGSQELSSISALAPVEVAPAPVEAAPAPPPVIQATPPPPQIPNSNFNLPSTVATNPDGVPSQLNLNSGNNFIPLRLGPGQQRLPSEQTSGTRVSFNPGTGGPPSLNFGVNRFSGTVQPAAGVLDVIRNPGGSFDNGFYVKAGYNTPKSR